VEPDASTDSDPGSVTHSHDDRRDAAHEPNDTSRAGGGLDLREGELKAAVSVATTQLSQDLHAVGSQLSTIETGHRALMERLHRIAEQADARAMHQFGSLQEQVEDARRQVLSAREDLELVRSSFLEADDALRQFGSLQEQVEGARKQILSAREDLELVRGSFLEQLQFQGESAEQQFHTTQRRFNETAQQLHSTEGRVQAAEDKHNSLEQRLRVTEQQNLDEERNRQRTDDWLQTTRNQLESVEQQLQATVQQLQEFQQQLMDGDVRIKSQDAEIHRIVEERHKKVETLIGELVQEMEQFKVHIPKLTGDDERIKSLHAMFRSNQRMHRFAVAASIVSLLMVVYIGLGKPGWPTIAHYLSLWVPGLKL
jgi:chromosome segregation ATPase